MKKKEIELVARNDCFVLWVAFVWGIESESREEDPEFSSAWNLIPTLSVPTGIFFSCSYSCPSFIFLIFSSSLSFFG